MKKIFLDSLPRNVRHNIDWINSVGVKVHFIYDDIKGDIEIIENINGSKIKVKYNDKVTTISTSRFKECKILKVLGIISKEFKYEIGQIIKDNSRDITIIDRKRTVKGRKLYRYKCNKCGFDCGKYYSKRDKNIKEEYWIREEALFTRKIGCACCSGQITVQGINDIYTTCQEIVKYFVNIEDSHITTKGSESYVLAKCPNCGYEKKVKVKTLYTDGFSCPRCSDGISYPEKFMFNVLEQCGVNMITQYSKNNSMWCKNYKYDFYFEKDNKKYIVETHGEQHYRYVGFKRTLQQEQENDKFKQELALQNGIDKYIIIDCRKSELEWIKNNILQSKLNEIFDLSNIDWNKCEEYAHKNLVKEVCEYWNNNKDNDIHIQYIYEHFNKIISMTTIQKYLKNGVLLGWCNYNSKEK